MRIEVIELLSNLVTALKEIMLVATPLYGGYVVAGSVKGFSQK